MKTEIDKRRLEDAIGQFAAKTRMEAMNLAQAVTIAQAEPLSKLDRAADALIKVATAARIVLEDLR